LNDNKEIFFYSENYSMSMLCEVRCFIEEKFILLCFSAAFILYLIYWVNSCMRRRKVNSVASELKDKIKMRLLDHDDGGITGINESDMLHMYL
jgi:hypothetical protein